MNVRALIFTAILAAVVCVCAPFAVPVGPVPISLATFAVYIVACAINWKIGTLAVVIYILLGAVGVPVFSGFTGGIGRIMGLTGGYILGFIPCAFVAGFMVDKLQFTLKLRAPLAMAVGTLCCYVLGTVWYMVVAGNGFVESLILCVVPFVIGDVVKIILASVVVNFVRPALKKYSAGVRKSTKRNQFIS